MIPIREKRIDSILLIAVIILVLIGIMMVYSSSSYRGAERYNNPFQFVEQHIIRVVIGFLLLFIISRIDYRMLYIIAPFLFLLGIGLLFLVLMSPEFHGSHRSIILFGKRFQPSEFMKLFLIIYLAAVFRKGDESPGLSGKPLLVHYGLFLLVVVLIFLEPDLGTAVVIFLIGFIMFLLGGVKWKNLFLMIFPPAVMLFTSIMIFDYQRNRVISFIDSVLNPQNAGYQIQQSLIGLAHGGILGVSYGGGKQKLLFLPEPFSDFILASVGEELGFIGILFVFVLLVIIIWRSIRVAVSVEDQFGFLLVGGIVTMIIINAILNSGVVVNLLPTTGLPFPFLSYGGSYLIADLIGIGVILNISKKITL
ncbi:MAG: putative peptidoglycan glycosyltransferase FtsW [bacterium]